MSELETIERWTVRRAEDGAPLAHYFDDGIALEQLQRRRERGERVFLEQAPAYMSERLS